MLNEFNKEILGKAVEVANRSVGIEKGQQEGPRYIMEAILDFLYLSGLENTPDVINLKENREEAERFIAGLLGMM